MTGKLLLEKWVKATVTPDKLPDNMVKLLCKVSELGVLSKDTAAGCSSKSEVAVKRPQEVGTFL